MTLTNAYSNIQPWLAITNPNNDKNLFEAIPDVIATLSRRIHARKSSDEFPHEIGICLGYPLEDVEGFINHKEEGCKTVGTWKVYGDVEQAEASFRRFRRCTTIYQRAWAQGRTLEELTVAS